MCQPGPVDGCFNSCCLAPPLLLSLLPFLFPHTTSLVRPYIFCLLLTLLYLLVSDRTNTSAGQTLGLSFPLYIYFIHFPAACAGAPIGVQVVVVCQTAAVTLHQLATSDSNMGLP